MICGLLSDAVPLPLFAALVYCCILAHSTFLPCLSIAVFLPSLCALSFRFFVLIETIGLLPLPRLSSLFSLSTHTAVCLLLSKPSLATSSTNPCHAPSMSPARFFFDLSYLINTVLVILLTFFLFLPCACSSLSHPPDPSSNLRSFLHLLVFLLLFLLHLIPSSSSSLLFATILALFFVCSVLLAAYFAHMLVSSLALFDLSVLPSSTSLPSSLLGVMIPCFPDCSRPATSRVLANLISLSAHPSPRLPFLRPLIFPVPSLFSRQLSSPVSSLP